MPPPRGGCLLSSTCLAYKPHFLSPVPSMMSGEQEAAGLGAHRVINSDLRKLY